MTPEAYKLWREQRGVESHWRMAARRAIAAVVDAHPALLADDAALLKAVDAAYPFGARQYLPYKMWLLERKALRAAMSVSAVPSRDEAEVCSVARDELELHPERVEEIRAMLDEQAPNRLGRRCPACAARPGDQCRNLEAAPLGTSFLACTSEPGGMDEVCIQCANHIVAHHGVGLMCPAPRPPHSKADYLFVPHEARLVCHRGAGPLFEARS